MPRPSRALHIGLAASLISVPLAAGNAQNAGPPMAAPAIAAPSVAVPPPGEITIHASAAYATDGKPIRSGLQWRIFEDRGGAGEKTVVSNRKAGHDYEILERFEAGMQLTGQEVKSLRGGHGSLAESYARVRGGEVWLEGMHITPYEQGNRWNPEPVRSRKLLLHRREIERLIGAVERKGLTLVPLELYFSRGRAKVALALGKGKKTHDRRQDIKRRIADREMSRAMKRV